MKKYVRGTILAGQIISLVIFSFFSLGFFTVASTYDYLYDALFRNIALFMGSLLLAEVPLAIIGIVQSSRPFRKFPKGMAIASSVFDGLLAIFLFVALVSPSGVQGVTGMMVALILILLGSAALLIVGTFKASKEKNQPLPFVFDPNGKNPETPSNDTRPEAVDSPKIPLSEKTMEQLAQLNKMYEYKLISKQEYEEKRYMLLANDKGVK